MRELEPAPERVAGVRAAPMPGVAALPPRIEARSSSSVDLELAGLRGVGVSPACVCAWLGDGLDCGLRGPKKVASGF